MSKNSSCCKSCCQDKPYLSCQKFFLRSRDDTDCDVPIRGNVCVCGSLDVKGKIKESSYDLIPPGTILPFAGTTSPPGGYLVCDGQAVSRKFYCRLFKYIGTTYGSGDGSTTFNLPDLRGRTIIGTGQGTGLTNRTLGATGGAETHTLTIPQMPIHDHTGTTDIAGAHTHTSNATGVPGEPGLVISSTGLVDDTTDGLDLDPTMGEPSLISQVQALTINSAGSHTHTFTIEETGGSQPHNNMQPFISLNYIIKYF